MKKLLVILCVLVLLALLVVPVLAGTLSHEDGPNRQMAPTKGGYRRAEAPSPAQMARGSWRKPSA